MIIGIFWRGQTIPEWRMDCINRLISLYPEATIKRDIVIDNMTRKDAIPLSDKWRIETAAKYKNWLYLDSDIYLDEKIELPECPAVAYEYSGAYPTMVWSGNNPSYFTNITFNDIIKDKEILTIKYKGTHWATDNNGNRVVRK